MWMAREALLEAAAPLVWPRGELQERPSPDALRTSRGEVSGGGSHGFCIGGIAANSSEPCAKIVAYAEQRKVRYSLFIVRVVGIEACSTSRIS